MLRTPVVLAFFLAAALVGMMLRYTDMSGGVETFELPSSSPAPLDTVTTGGVSPISGTRTLMGSEAKPVPELPYEIADDNALGQFMQNKVGPDCCPSPFSSDVGCICLTEADKKGFASRFGNKTSM